MAAITLKKKNNFLGVLFLKQGCDMIIGWVRYDDRLDGSDNETVR